MLTVGVDTYVSLDDADTYIAENYLSSDADCIAWLALSDSDKEVILRNACRQIEAVMYNGRKLDAQQALSFPRIQNGVLKSDMSKVKASQVEEAIYMCSSTYVNQKKRQELIAQGVKSFSLGDLSESYGDNSAMQSKTVALSSRSAVLLSSWIGGSVCVR